ncbi:hypothetical protein BH18ACT2_BH18ACT2_23310 [soil metagenome]
MNAVKDRVGAAAGASASANWLWSNQFEDAEPIPPESIQLPMRPPSSLVITRQDERGRPPVGPSGQEL